ncbi:MAG: hypothetical protein AB1646_20395 [Thermodesulfobacteriota bacterium]
MTHSENDSPLGALEQSLNMLTRRGQCLEAFKEIKARDLEWKTTDPGAYKKDLEEMCRKIFGDQWEAQYRILLREEFPGESDPT